MMKFLSQPWPWYVAGPIIGLMVPGLLILGNRPFGVSSSLKHICAACIPAGIPYFKYGWKKESWSLFFVAGIVVGAWIAANVFHGNDPVAISSATMETLKKEGITDFTSLLPGDIFNIRQVFTLRGFIFFIAGGFMVGFGTRYAEGCTSGHSIMGLSTLQWPSLVATCCFMIGGFAMTWLILPYLLKL
ncbi:MAG: YeeE/YedE thiosulfate transporter family protein [Flavitalea sp.]